MSANRFTERIRSMSSDTQSSNGLPEGVKGLEMHHGVYVRHPNKEDDAIFVKEYIHKTDGARVPRLRMYENFKRPFWITKPGFRNHEEKKEWEEVGKLQRYNSTDAKLTGAVRDALNMPYFQGSKRQLNRNPYIYGTEVSLHSLLKYRYQKRFPDCIHPSSSVAALDTETDVLNDKDAFNLIMCSVAYEKTVYVSVLKDFVKRFPNPKELIEKTCVKMMPEYFGPGGDYQLEVVLVDDAGAVAKTCLDWTHAQKPDWLSIWNLDFDFPVIESNLQRHGYNVADTLCDPFVPKPYRYYKYRQGQKTKMAESGRETTKAPYEQWHTVIAPATFQWIDAMCVYHDLRKAGGKQDGYGLDHVLNKFLNRGKLKHEECKAPEGTFTWHVEMQRDWPLEYVAYNIFDSLGLLLLDKKIKDIEQAVGVQLGYSEYHDMCSNPRRLQTDATFFCLENGYVIGTVSDQMETELDHLVTDRTGWVVTLNAYMMRQPGFQVFHDTPSLIGRVFAHCADLDIEGTYPNEENALNISKATTRFEVSRIQGVSENLRRLVGVDMSTPTINAIWLSQTVNQLHGPEEWYQQYLKEKENA